MSRPHLPSHSSASSTRRVASAASPSTSSSLSSSSTAGLAHFSRLAMDPDQATAREASRANAEAEDDEDDAWALDSDDEEFAWRQQQRSAVGSGGGLARGGGGPSLAASMPYRPNRTVSTSSFVSAASAGPAASSTSLSSSSSSSGVRKHAPPARPHPFPLPSAATSTNRSHSTPVPVIQQQMQHHHQQNVPSHPTRTSSTTNTSSSEWTVVDQAKTRNRSQSSSRSPTDPVLAGSPPTDVGATAAEAVLQASLRDQKRKSVADERPVTPPLPATGLDKTKDKQTQWYATAIRPRVLEILDDPFVALQALAANSAGSRPSGLESVPSTPNTAAQREQEHAQSLGRGFNDINGGSTPLTSPTSSKLNNFEPISMAGDGVTMSGSKWTSSVTSLQRGVGQDSPASATLDVSADDSQLRRGRSVRTRRRWREFFRCLKCDVDDDGESATDRNGHGNATDVDLAKLRELSWNGIPTELRPIVWPLLLGYVPAHSSMRCATLSRKREDYRKAVHLAFGYDAFRRDADHSYDRPQTPTSASAAAAATSSSTPRAKAVKESEVGSRPHTPVAGKKRGSDEEKIWHQISIDVPRTNPGLPLWQRSSTQRALERLLYVWAIRHHATGYVQGMSDLATPFFQVFLSIYLNADVKVEEYDIAALPVEVQVAIEADTYWCLGKLLDGIQENYIFAQPGIQRQVRRMEELVGRIDAPLHAHLKAEQVEYIQFAFRWMNCLLMREMSVRNVTRLWDTYLAEGPDAFSDFHLYVCSVFLCKWSEKLREMDFQGCIMFLQSLPTQSWSDKDAELLLSEAFVFKNLFGQTKHLGD